MNISIRPTTELPITTFGELPDGAAFQIVWAVPGPKPEPPPQTIFTKIAPRQLGPGTANAVYRSEDSAMHHATAVPDHWKVLRMPTRYAIGVAEEDKATALT